jgi:signal transduction histidine kinase
MAGVAGIGVLTILADWGRWTDVALLVAQMAVLTAANGWITAVLLRRIRPRAAEWMRLVVNLAIALPVFHILHWPLPVWLFLPFSALAYDHTNRAVSIRGVVVNCAALTVLALHDGVSPLYPAVFVGFTAIVFNIMRARHDAYVELATSLRQAQKLEAVGRLASGIAHEINTPLQYTRDNVRFLEGTMREVLGLIVVYQDLHEKMVDKESASTLVAAARRADEAADLPYLLEHAEEACKDSAEGLDRIAAIVASMRHLAHPQQIEMSELDLNAAIAQVLVVANHEYRYVADVETALVDLPPVLCHPGLISQMILNIVVNAAHAIADARAGAAAADRGLIAITSVRAGDDVVIAISDNGPGIPDAICTRVFEPFFTTKDVGRGTGQGLAIARSVAEQHGGALTFVSRLGKGTTFSLRLPMRGRRPVAT